MVWVFKFYSSESQEMGRNANKS